MQEADEPARGGTGTQAAEPARTLSPIAAFLILLAIGAVALGAFLLTREDDAEPAARDRGPAFALTDEEAIERFRELEALYIRAYRQRDLSLLSQIYVPGSRIEETVAKEIRKLIRADVVPRPTFTTDELEVITNESSEITVRQTVEESSRFIHESGQDATGESGHQRLVVDWTLTRIGSRWLISDSLIIEAQDLPDQTES
jgi:hypothetical protein